jgi:hypothetical protein
MAVNKGLRRIGRSWALDPGAAHAGHQSGMPDSIPLQQRNRPPSQRNTVRHHSGMLSAISPESCPSWRGTRSSAKSTGLSVAQTQSATLVASIEQSRAGAVLDTTNGNYDLYRINDSTSTTTSFAYADSKLQSAAIVNQVNQSEVYQKLVDHKVVEQTTTPCNKFTIQDISALLRPAA